MRWALRTFLVIKRSSWAGAQGLNRQILTFFETTGGAGIPRGIQPVRVRVNTVVPGPQESNI